MALGRLLRDAAASGGAVDEYGRSQLLAGYSVARHLSAEQRSAAGLRAWFRRELADSLASAPDGALVALAERVRGGNGDTELSEIACEALDRLREHDPHGAVRIRLQGLVRELANREVEALGQLPD